MFVAGSAPALVMPDGAVTITGTAEFGGEEAVACAIDRGEPMKAKMTDRQSKPKIARWRDN